MTLTIPPATTTVLDNFENNRPATVDYLVAQKLSEVLRDKGLTPHERNGAWAEATAFNFMPSKDSPWNTYFGPSTSWTKGDGSPFYAPDIAEADADVVSYWEHRALEAQHPVLRARYADIVWVFKHRVTQQQPDIQYARCAIDAYIDGVENALYKEPYIHAVHALQRALDLAHTINDKARADRCKQAMLILVERITGPGHSGSWTTLTDELLQNKKLHLTPAEVAHLMRTAEGMLTSYTTVGDTFDPFSAQAVAEQLATHYEQQGSKHDVHRVIRAYGQAFETAASQAASTLAITWLQPVYDEYRNRGMKDDAARALATINARGAGIASELKTIQASVNISDDELQRFLEQLTVGTAPEAFQRIAKHFIPNTADIAARLQNLLTIAPFTALIGITKIVDGRFAAKAGSVQDDPEGRLIMQLAQDMGIAGIFLTRGIQHLRQTHDIATETILKCLDECPLFTPERRTLLADGINGYLADDFVKALHVLIPQIEEALRQLMTLVGASPVKAGRNGTTQVKNLNDILREPAIKEALGDDLRLYLLTLLADERGTNLRNTVCHGLANPQDFTQAQADRVLHALLALALLRATEAPE